VDDGDDGQSVHCVTAEGQVGRTNPPVLNLGEILLEIRVESLVVKDEDDRRSGGVDGVADEVVPNAVDPPAGVHNQTADRRWRERAKRMR
jgi:hypothetical protein